MSKKAVIAVLICVLGVVANVNAGDKVSVKYKTEELAFLIGAFNTIELTGEEVSVFVDIRNNIITVYKEASSGKKQTGEVTFSLANAKNCLYFMQRIKIKGAEASIFNDISSKMVEAIKKEAK